MSSLRSFVGISKLFALAALLFTVGCSQGAEPRADSISGTLVQTIGRDADGTTRAEYYLKNKSSWIRLSGQANVLESKEPNSHVIARGHWTANQQLIVDTLESASEPGVISEALSSNAAKGRVAIFLIKDQSLTSDPFPKQDASNAILQGPTSTNSYFQETSFGAFGLSGDIFGWYTADISNCNSFQKEVVSSQVEQQAAAQNGFVTDNYRHAIHIFVRNGGSCFLAFGTFGAPDGVGTIWSFNNTGNTIAHEIGHNLGLHHASSFTCTNSAFEVVPYGTRCQFNEYNDPYDAMGFDGFYFQYNSYSKSLEGWLPAANQRRVTAAGQFTIVPQETAVNGVQSLLVPIPNTNQLFHVEMRKQFGFDSESRFAGPVLIRRVVEPGLFQFTDLLDMSPDQNFGDAGMQVGQTFQDPLSGISIGLVSKTASQAVVSVAFNGPSCSDGAKNGTETGVDCGGLCNACDAGQGCVHQRDCSGFACSAGTCVASAGGLTGSYYIGTNFETFVDTRLDKAIDFDWGNGSPLPSLPSDQFSVRWQGKVVAPQTATYTFRTDTDDGARLWVDNQLIIDRFFDGVGPTDGTIALTAGQEYDIRMDYFENGGGAYARLLWSTPTMPLDLIPPTQLIPTAGCTAQSALDLGPRTTFITVPSNACVKVSQYPNWWSFGNGNVTLQSAGTGTFPIPATWQDACTSVTGQFTFTSLWQSQPIGTHTASCPALIQLNGNGTPLQLSWF